MPFDKPTRNRLASFVAEARRLIADEFTQQFQSLYGISDKGTITPLYQLGHLDDAGLAIASLLRERIDYLVKIHPDDREGIKAAVARLAREQAFTILNRLAAIRMAEKRGLIAESVGKGYQSKGFKVFETVAGSALGDTYHRYRRYLFCLFDELAIDLGLLFDRRSPQALIFPQEPALLALLDRLHAADLEPLWAEDETIGWIYQYYNDPDERKKMRKESAAPRNSRELAVRNQFFTPRYVVEFLTDNTLGRIWYEMTKSQTSLVHQCRYLVRRPTEIFLSEGEAAPETPNQEGISQEELLKQPVYIPHRPIKDPREIRLLDPACGSMHFGLYAFDLFETIYEEAWDNGFCPALQEEYASRDEFLRYVPRLIIEHNIHGIDIDPRAVQIAGLSLWLRAQKAWQIQGAKHASRPRVRRSNIVCAEPMPGSHEMLEGFIKTLDQPLLGELVKTVFDKMHLAGEAGSLLKIEEEIRIAIDTARKAWEKIESAPRQLSLTEELNQSSKAPNLAGLEKALTTDFWDTAEQQVIDTLRAYAEQADANSYQRRLFADDAARGFAFIDLCRKRYDVALMNPPFGDASSNSKEYLNENYSTTKYDLFAMFVCRWLERLETNGGLGAITNKTGFFLQTMESWRTQITSEPNSLYAAIDLGFGVLDSAMVETMAYTIHRSSSSVENSTLFVRLATGNDKGSRLQRAIDSTSYGRVADATWIRKVSEFAKIPRRPTCYWVGHEFLTLFEACETFSPKFGHIYQGIATGDNFRFLRTRWEVPLTGLRGGDWATYAKGGSSKLWVSDFPLVVRWRDDGLEIKANAQQCYGSASRTVKNECVFFQPGLTYTQVTIKGFFARAMPAGAVFDMKGPLLTVTEQDLHVALGVFCSLPIRALAKLVTDCRQWHPTNLMELPYPNIESPEAANLSKSVLKIIGTVQREIATEESSSIFCAPKDSIAPQDLEPECIGQIDSIVAKAFGTRVSDFQELDALLYAEGADGDEESDSQSDDIHQSFIHYFFGTTLGRWDIRYTTGERNPPELPGPFAPLPVCPPGMLQNAECLPAEPNDVPADYPLRISWPGILVDEENHPDDLVARVRESIEVIWKDRAEAIEQESCDILVVKTLRDYFRRPAAFFADHLKRYSKSRRQAPIYWPLSTKSGSYTLWLYYHRLTDQTLHTCLADFLGPKIKMIQSELDAIIAAGGGGTRLGELREFLDELHDFRDEIESVIKLPWKPNLNDGVLITASPLWKLFRLPKWQKDLKTCWEKLETGEYDWAQLAYSIWPKRVEEVCKKDRSIAIAHSLEHLCQVEQLKHKTKRGKKKPVFDDEE